MDFHEAVVLASNSGRPNTVAVPKDGQYRYCCTCLNSPSHYDSLKRRTRSLRQCPLEVALFSIYFMLTCVYWTLLTTQDSDEFHDKTVRGSFNSWLTTKTVSLKNVDPHSVLLTFASTWKPHAAQTVSPTWRYTMRNDILSHIYIYIHIYVYIYIFIITIR